MHSTPARRSVPNDSVHARSCSYPDMVAGKLRVASKPPIIVTIAATWTSLWGVDTQHDVLVRIDLIEGRTPDQTRELADAVQLSPVANRYWKRFGGVHTAARVGRWFRRSQAPNHKVGVSGLGHRPAGPGAPSAVIDAYGVEEAGSIRSFEHLSLLRRVS